MRRSRSGAIADLLLKPVSWPPQIRITPQIPLLPIGIPATPCARACAARGIRTNRPEPRRGQPAQHGARAARRSRGSATAPCRVPPPTARTVPCHVPGRARHGSWARWTWAGAPPADAGAEDDGNVRPGGGWAGDPHRRPGTSVGIWWFALTVYEAAAAGPPPLCLKRPLDRSGAGDGNTTCLPFGTAPSYSRRRTPSPEIDTKVTQHVGGRRRNWNLQACFQTSI
jgi:hypothetical protein